MAPWGPPPWQACMPDPDPLAGLHGYLPLQALHEVQQDWSVPLALALALMICLPNLNPDRDSHHHPHHHYGQTLILNLPLMLWKV